MIRALAERGGIIGLNFYGAFLNADAKSINSRISDILRHARHIVNVGGIGCLGLGSDFDGMEGELEIGDISQMPRLLYALHEDGFSDSEVERLAWKNAHRVISEVMR